MTGPRPISVIAAEIESDWENVYFGAKPYLEAMTYLRDIDGAYYEDSARTVVRYFLANAVYWRGPVARRVKAELKGMLQA